MEKTQVIVESSPVEPPLATDVKSGLNLKKIALNLLKVGVSTGLIVWILHSTNIAEIGTAILAANIWLVVMAFLLHVGGFVIGASRWRILLRSRGSDASILFLVESYLVGMFFNNFLPSTIGGDVYRTYDSWRLGQSKSNALAVVFVDRFLGLVVLMLFALLALLSSNELTTSIPYLFVWIGLGTLCMVLFVWFILKPPQWLPRLVVNLKVPFSNKIRSIVEAFLAFQGEHGVLAKAFLLSALLQVNVVLHYYFIAKAISLPIPLISFFLIVPLATIITMLPISVNGIGVRENVYIFFFAPFAVANPEAVAFAWIAYGLVVLQGIMGGVVYLLRR